MTAKYRRSTDLFTFTNVNPRSLVRAADCVARAISFATGLSWEDTIRELTEFGIGIGGVFNEKATYGAWLEKNGWTKMKQPRKANRSKYTIEELIEAGYVTGTVIVSIAGHLTVIKDGKVRDTWNCLCGTVLNYWIK